MHNANPLKQEETHNCLQQNIQQGLNNLYCM